MAATVVYCRISKDVAGEHLGVERQEKACRELAKSHGLTVADVLVDNDVSAYKKKRRPEFERLVELLHDGRVDTVIAYHPDRLYRRTRDLERLVDVIEGTKAKVFTVAAGAIDLTTASGRMVAHMLGAAAQHESERLSERQKMKHDESASKGRAPGGRPPYGYSWDTIDGRRTYVVNPVEAAVVRRIVADALEGRSMLAIANALTAEGTPTREGRPWAHSTVRAVIVNPAVCGLRVHRREIAGVGDWEPILDRATWEEVKAVVADPARKRKRPPRRYLLTGLVENHLGERMISRPGRGAGGGYDRRQYVAPSPSKAATTIGADDLEQLVVALVLKRLDKAALPVPDESTDAGGEVAAIDAELRELAALRGAGVVSLGEWMAARTPLLERHEEAKARAGSRVRRRASLTDLLSKPGAVRREWEAGRLDLDQQREIVDAVVERIVIGPATRGRWTPVEDRVTVELRDRK